MSVRHSADFKNKALFKFVKNKYLLEGSKSRMKMLKNLKNKKGFTLIEIVIVIVIIAILAAMLVPSLLKWVDNANKKSFLEAANTIKTSTLSNMSENYGTGGSFAPDAEEVQALVGSGVTITYDTTNEPTGPVDNGTKNAYTVYYTTADNDLTKMIVANGSYCATFENSNWTFSDEAGE